MKQHRYNAFIVFFLSLLVFSFATTTVSAQPQVQDWSTCSVDGVPTLKCLEVVYLNLLFGASILMGVALFAMLLWGGVQIMGSHGDPKGLEKGVNTIKWAFLGIGIFAVSYLIMLIIDTLFLGGQGTIFQLNLPGPVTPTP